MTQVTPPGWYPDPGQKQDGPATERWWDGKAWTDRVRPAGPAAAWAPPAQPSAPSPAQPAAPDPAQPAAPDSAQPSAPDSAQPSAPDSARPSASDSAQSPVPGAPQFQAAPGPAQPPATGSAQPVAYGSAPGAYPVHPGYPGYPVQPPSARRRRLRTGIAVAAAVAVLAGIGAGVYVLTDDGSGGGSASSQQDRRGPGGQDTPFGGEGGGEGGESPAPDSPGESEPPTIDSGSVTDRVSGISLPIPDGWSGQQFPVGATVTSDDSYECPAAPSESCTKGGAYSAPQEALETEGGTAEEVAKADIRANAEESYGDAYGGLASHEELASKAVTVAGQKGWLVRWKAVTKEGSDGYVESLAFPAPADPERIVVVRFGVDVEEGQAVIDEITEGIEADTSGGGGGTGQDV
ncbi:DUF2510 domain-containing protein [Streptomyces sp. Babs14]|uniref:DUF2510 domain-containing protein n=1 Tax=unclassified Streptomyces TaxID=2593676 RepID=UPI001C234EC9|nr:MULTISPECIES: DUF2510 domain-containing protein [unclassified Streptomyces]MBU8552950.1 DUF2510 domain-containing protein [Streptomyces sp. Osf17]MBU8559744.1 DUF2510 domain-containing protein [Streptomyces sp. Babs14]